MGGATPEFHARLRELASGQSRPVVIDRHTGSGPKMSEVLLEWAAPLLEPFAERDLKAYRKALTFAVLVWNEATDSDEPADVVAENIMTIATAAGGAAPLSMRDLVAGLVEDRREIYGADRRLILEADAHDKPDRRHVSVAVLAPDAR